MPYVYSTASNSGTYVEYKPDNNKGVSHSVILRKVTIKGGHGVATKHLVTPKGVVTQVTDDELEFLLKNKSFQNHVKAGFITYDNKKVAPEKKAADMAEKDGAAPLTTKDFEKGDYSSEEGKIYKNRKVKG